MNLSLHRSRDEAAQAWALLGWGRMDCFQPSPIRARAGTNGFPLGVRLIALAGVALRLIAVFWIPTVPVSDMWSYFQRASSLADLGVYEAIMGHPDASYPPGYPLLLAPLFCLAGDRLLAAKVLNVALGAASIVLIAALAEKLFGRRTALVAAALLALSPRAILMCLILVSENLFLPALLAWVLLLTAQEMPSARFRLILGGALLGVLGLIRAVAYLLWVPWLISLIPHRPNARRVIGNLALVLLAQHAVMLPWALRNQRSLDQFTFLTTTGGINLFIGNNPRATGEWYSWLNDMKERDPAFSERSVAEANAVAGGVALEWIRDNPWQAASLYIRKWQLIFRNDHFPAEAAIFAEDISPPWPAGDVLVRDHPLKHQRETVFSLLDLFYWFLLSIEAVGAVASFGASRSGRRPVFLTSWILLVLVAIYFPMVSAVFIAATRFHWPTIDLLIPFGAVALVCVSGLRRGRLKSPHPPSEPS